MTKTSSLRVYKESISGLPDSKKRHSHNHIESTGACAGTGSLYSFTGKSCMTSKARINERSEALKRPGRLAWDRAVGRSKNSGGSGGACYNLRPCDGESFLLLRGVSGFLKRGGGQVVMRRGAFYVFCQK
jgi:hypothetical protein